MLAYCGRRKGLSTPRNGWRCKLVNHLGGAGPRLGHVAAVGMGGITTP